MARFSKKSKDKLDTCDVRLQDLFQRIVEDYDCVVLEGARDPIRQIGLYNEGKSKVKHGKHNFFPSLAIDISPYPIPKNWGEGDHKELAKFYHFAGFVLAKANSLGILLRWGGDWDGDGDFSDQTFDDLIHYEIL